MKRHRKAILAIVVIMSAGLLFTAFLLPIIVRGQLEKQVSAATGRKFTVAAVKINPLNWSAEVSGASLSEKDGKSVFASFSSLRFRVSPTSVWRMAPVVAELKVRSPYVHLLRSSPNRYNFTDILEKQPKKKAKSGQTRFSLNNIVIENGLVEFDDQTVAEPCRHRVEQLVVHLPFISNISYFADRYVDPRFSAVVNGAPLDFRGKLKPFAKGTEATVKLNLEGLDIPFYATYFPKELPLVIDKGELFATLEVSHRLERGGKPDINISGRLDLKDISLSEKSGAKLLAWKSLKADIKGAGLLTKSFEIASIELDQPEVNISRNSGGEWNFSRLAAKKPAATETPSGTKPAKSSEKPKVSIKSAGITGGLLRFRDALPSGGFAADIKELSLKVDNFATAGEAPASYRLSFVTGLNERGEADGNLLMEPLTLSSRVSLSGLVMEAAYPYLAATLREPVKGRADFSGDLAFGAEWGLSVERAMLTLKGLKAQFGPSDGVQLPLVIFQGGALSLKERNLSIDRVTVRGGKVELSRDESGRLSTELLLQPKGAASKAGVPAGKSTPPFVWRIGAVAVSGLDAAFTDGTNEEKPRFTFERIKATAASVKGPRFGEIPFTFAAGYGGQGNISAEGRALPEPLRLKAALNLKGIPVIDAEPYLPEGVNLTLIDGKLDAGFKLDLFRQDGGVTGSFSGDAGVRDFYTLDAEGSEDLLKWESLQLEGINGTLRPFTLAMSGVTVNNYYARVIINKGGRINLQEIYTPAKPSPQEGGVTPDATPPKKPQPPAGGKSIRIDAVTLQDGKLNFTDYHLNREFSTTMLNLGGRITGLSSDTGGAADLDLRGNLENHSPLKIVGKINPLKGDLFLDMQIDFSDIELSPFTPYSGTFLGYVIDKGKLSLTLKYHVENKKLRAENKVFMDQFTFGDSVESQKATKLPVRLAVALLKDRKGEIHLDLPLSGRTDDPKFSIWGVLGQMLKNLLVKVATSPIALLQSAFGGKDDFSGVTFAYGSSRLSPEEEAKLRGLAKAINDRPGLRLEVSGFVDRDRDSEGYRRELLARKIKTEKFLAIVKEKHESSGLSPDKVSVTPEEESRLLKTVYEKEKFPRPRTVIGTLKSLPDPEMRKLILANTVVGEEQFRSLARDRVVAVTYFLVKEGGLHQERLFEKSGDIFVVPAKEGAAARVEFGVVAK